MWNPFNPSCSGRLLALTFMVLGGRAVTFCILSEIPGYWWYRQPAQCWPRGIHRWSYLRVSLCSILLCFYAGHKLGINIIFYKKKPVSALPRKHVLFRWVGSGRELTQRLLDDACFLPGYSHMHTDTYRILPGVLKTSAEKNNISKVCSSLNRKQLSQPQYSRCFGFNNSLL